MSAVAEKRAEGGDGKIPSAENVLFLMRFWLAAAEQRMQEPCFGCSNDMITMTNTECGNSVLLDTIPSFASCLK
ncbi:unnamed protein product [Larinioides sclopetarius]|uniref:Uncharacterized protein n=1 Tax=Larinioides sclopetarius TaxID=280406 RepID=A0AAV1YX33_9ARAC